MDLAVTQLHPLFGAKIAGVDLSKPIDEDTQRAIARAMDEYAVCVMPAQRLEDERQIAFARCYGPLEVIAWHWAQRRTRQCADQTPGDIRYLQS
jgi:alpha-ketoglutarate-dependent 2,4-dichlorophenoxyacetate dioxygenase